MTLWYDLPETAEEQAARRDHYGNEMYPAPAPFDRVVDRAQTLVRTHTVRPSRGLALPFGLPSPEALRWRISFDVGDVLRRGPALSALGPLTLDSSAQLFGIHLAIDPEAPPGTLLLERIDGTIDGTPEP